MERLTIIGSGIAGITVAEEVRKRSPGTPISVLTREPHGHYARPMLSHGFSKDDVEDKIILRTLAALAGADIEVATETEVLAIDRTNRNISCRKGDEPFSFAYDTLILAPGSDALVPGPFRTSACPFHVVNSLDDLLALRRLRAGLLAAGRRPRWAVVGGGLIGCEVASDLAKAGDGVALFHALGRLMERQLAEEDSAALLSVLESQAIEIRLNAAVQGFEKDGDGCAVQLTDRLEAGFDAIIVACGFKPRIDLAQSAGLAVNRGILVNSFLRTEDPAIFALGDAAECPDGRIYAYIMPIRHQAQWLARFLAGDTADPWQAPEFKPRAKVHGFTAAHPYLF